MPALLERIGVERPIVQAGMGGGLARHELAAAVSEAGGLGTLGILPAGELECELADARLLTDRPIAINLLGPFVRRAHRRVAADADLVVTFWARPRRPGPKPWLHQCGSVEEIRAAHAAGADGAIVQGAEAGGHVRGELRGFELLERARTSVPAGFPLLLAGGIAGPGDVRAALEAGAEAAVAGTRFLLSEESRAHPGYKQRLLSSERTILTELFGLGWPAAPHRVVPNAATERWGGAQGRGRGWIRAANRVLSPLAGRAPEGAQRRLLARQSPALPLLSPQPPTDDAPERLLESGPLYAGETVSRIEAIDAAARIVSELTA
jgi:NAD(P)H-dependent flavin oxidoreductase YrpB (nitropropane dioxygenase family)